MVETIQINFAHPIPVFPLPGSVLLPHAALPLHIFEPRYLRMAQDSLDSHGLIAMGLFEGEVTQEQYLHGRPALRPCVCVGYIEQYKTLEEGRFLLLLRGLCRAKIVREEDHEPYRLFYLEPTDLDQDNDAMLSEQRLRLLDALDEPGVRELEGVKEIQPLLDRPEVPTTALVDIVAMQVCEDPEPRYELLAEPNAPRRAAKLLQKLDALRRAAHPD